MSILLLIIGLFLFIALVVVHEFGHFIAARRNGVDVEEFGIGFPPRAATLSTRKGTRYTLNWLPIGGFVKLKGEHDQDTEPGSFGAASPWAKTKIMLAGVGMNLITALLMLTFIALIGIPKLIDNQFTVKSDTKVTNQKVLVSYVEPGSPAEKAGLKVQDQILYVGMPLTLYCENQQKCIPTIKTSSELTTNTHINAGANVQVIYLHDGQQISKTVTLRTTEEVDASKKTDNPKGFLGIAPTEYTLQRSTWSAPVVAAGVSYQFTTLTLKGLGKALAGLGGIIAGTVTGNHNARAHSQSEAAGQVGGPVAIFFILKDSSMLGWSFLLFIIAIVSLTLAIMNALPIPALDGGRLFVMLLFRGLHKPLKQGTEEAIHGTGFAILMLLVVLITVVDVKRFL